MFSTSYQTQLSEIDKYIIEHRLYLFNVFILNLRTHGILPNLHRYEETHVKIIIPNIKSILTLSRMPEPKT